MIEMSKYLPWRKPMDPSRDVVFGHEFCCEVLDYGPGCAGRIKKGARVVSIPRLIVGNEVQGIGYSNDNPGAYAERILLSEELIQEVPAHVSTETAALTEPLAVGIHGPGAIEEQRARSAGAGGHLRSHQSREGPR